LGEYSGMEKPIHATVKRLFKAAKTVRPEITTAAQLARALNQSEQTINNWMSRETGVSKIGRLEAQKMLGISAIWIESEDGPMLVGENGPSKAAVASSPGSAQGHAPDLPVSAEAQALIDAIMKLDRAGASLRTLSAAANLLSALADEVRAAKGNREDMSRSGEQPKARPSHDKPFLSQGDNQPADAFRVPATSSTHGHHKPTRKAG
jgi:hypothetical protein